MTTLNNHPRASACGVFDRSVARLRHSPLSRRPTYDSAEALLGDPEIRIVVNLTTPESHFEVSRQALEAGKHVYCEKPLAMNVDDAAQLVALGEARGLTVATAPANALSDAHRLVSSALDAGRIGTPRLVYAEMEDGPVFRSNWATWRSHSGAPWPGLHEFEIGCTLEHAGYALSWLVSLFGAVESLTAFSALTFPDKGPGTRESSWRPTSRSGACAFDPAPSPGSPRALPRQRIDR